MSSARLHSNRSSMAVMAAALIVFGLRMPAIVYGAEPWDEPQDTSEALNQSDKYAWRLFVALNWPADTANRIADATKPFGENATTVWESWKLSSGRNDEVFLADGADPGEWLPGKALAPRKLDDFESMPLQQTFRAHGGEMQPSFDAGTSPFGRNENHLNKAAYEFIRENELYNIDGQERLYAKAKAVFEKARVEDRVLDSREYKLHFPLAAKEVKAQWRQISLEDKPRYRWVEFIDAAGVSKLYGLTSLHITTKDLPNWLWATFEHVDNPSRENAEPWLIPTVDLAAGPKGYPDGLGIEGTRWENYRLRGTQTEFVNSVGEATLLANSQIEAGFQSTSSCITCHARAAIGPRREMSEAANRLSIFKYQYPATVIGSVGNVEESLFVRRTTNDPIRGELDYLQLDFVWSLFRAQRKATP